MLIIVLIKKSSIGICKRRKNKRKISYLNEIKVTYENLSNEKKVMGFLPVFFFLINFGVKNYKKIRNIFFNDTNKNAQRKQWIIKVS